MAKDRVAIFVDGNNIYLSAKSIGVTVDWEKLKNELAEQRDLVRPYYYAGTDETRGQLMFLDKLRYMGYDVKVVPLRDYGGKPFTKGVDVMLVTDMLHFAVRDNYDIAILASGDKDYVHPVKTLRDMGKRVEIASFDHSMARELRLVADRFFSLTEIKDKITRKKTS